MKSILLAFLAIGSLAISSCSSEIFEPNTRRVTFRIIGKCSGNIQINYQWKNSQNEQMSQSVYSGPVNSNWSVDVDAYNGSEATFFTFPDNVSSINNIDMTGEILVEGVVVKSASAKGQGASFSLAAGVN